MDAVYHSLHTLLFSHVTTQSLMDQNGTDQ